MQSKEQEARFEIKDLLGIGLTLVVLVIAIAYGLELLGEQKEDMCTTNYDEGRCFSCPSTHTTYNASDNLCYNTTHSSSNTTDDASVEFNATSDGMSAIAKIPNKLPMIVTVVIAAVIIGVLIRYLWVSYN